jgi:hypothetical protein
MIATSALLAAHAEEAKRHLPMAPVGFGILAIVLLGITFAFRSSGTKH